MLRGFVWYEAMLHLSRLGHAALKLHGMLTRASASEGHFGVMRDRASHSTSVAIQDARSARLLNPMTICNNHDITPEWTKGREGESSKSRRQAQSGPVARARASRVASARGQDAESQRG
jgi:hypothetical protein